MLVWWFLLRRKGPKYQRPEHHPSQLDDTSSSLPGELEDKEKLHELHGRQHGHEVHEVEARPARRGPFEVAGQARRP